MKNAITTATALMIICSQSLYSCDQNPNKTNDESIHTMEEMESDNTAHQNEIESEMEDSTRHYDNWQHDMESFKKDVNEQIEENKQEIARLREKAKEKSSDIKANYNKSIDKLEEKNKDLQAKLDNRKGDAKDGWESFKSEFNHDMNELGKAIKTLGEDNKK